MKKTLLSLLACVMCVGSSWALTTDGQVYEPVDGLHMVNQWIFDRVHTGKDYNESVIANSRARTATMLDGIIYVARSEEKAVIVNDKEAAQSVLHRFKVEDGSPLPDLDLTLNGEPYVTFLGATSIGRDNFGHLWVAPMTSNLAVTVPIYLVNTETGELTLIANLSKGNDIQRTDYLDVIGDLTCEQAECNIMTVGGATADPGTSTVYRWHADQGYDFEGGFDGDYYMYFTQFYPDTKTGFSLAPVVKMLLGTTEEDMYSGELFYIDCFDSAPTLYSVSGDIFDTFEGVDEALIPQNAPNGIAEFSIDGRNFFVYARADMNGDGHGCQANICEFHGEEMAFADMTKCWQIPADSLGKVNDGGLRVHCFAVDKEIDENGDEVVTLLTFKSCNGMAVYKIGKNVKPVENDKVRGDLNADGIVDVTDVSIAIDMVLGKQEQDLTTADLTGDGTIDVSDVSAIIDIVLGK